MTRITVEQVVEAYANTGLQPMTNDWIEYKEEKEKWCGCALSACVLAVLPELGTSELEEEMMNAEGEEYVADVLDISRQYLAGFVRGFDGRDIEKTLERETVGIQDDETIANILLEVWKGYQDGKSARAAVFTKIA